MINDSNFRALTDYFITSTPFIEVFDINLYSTIVYGESEYKYHCIKQNKDALKKVSNAFIESLQNIKNYVNERPEDNEFKIIEKYINELSAAKKNFVPYLKPLNSESVNIMKARNDFEKLSRMNKDLRILDDIMELEYNYQNLNREFSHEKNNLLIGSFATFIGRVNEVQFNIDSIKEDTNTVYQDSIDIYYNDINKELSKIKSMFDNENDFINEFLDGDFKDAKIFDKFFELKEKVDKSYTSCFNRFKNHMNLSSYADYIVNADENDLSSFVKKKSIIDDLKLTIKLTGPKYSELKIFSDNSILLTHKNGEQTSYSDTLGYCEAISNVIKNEFNEALKKYPTIAKKFLEILDTNIGFADNAKLAMNTFLESHQILKSSKFNIVDYFNNYDLDSDPFRRKFFENLDDKMNAIIKTHKVKQFAESILSNKYRHLYNEESYSIFSDIFDAEINKSQLQNMIGKKIAFYKTPEQFNDGLRDVFEKLNGFHIEGYLAKAEEYKAKVISNEDNVLILQIENFEQSEKLGSTSWCISRQEYYFNSYTSDNNKQFFVYNFNLDSTDEDSMIGMTLHKDNSLYVAHSKFDEAIELQTSELHQYEMTIVNKLNSEENAELHNKTKNNNQLN